MDDERKPIGKDASGYDVLTTAVKALLNQFPGLYEYEAVKFEELEKDCGIAFSADNGALIFSETEDVIGGVHQTCQYPFYIVYRTSSTKERQKISIQEFLDTFGKWLCREPVVIGGNEQRLSEYPISVSYTHLAIPETPFRPQLGIFWTTTTAIQELFLTS